MERQLQRHIINISSPAGLIPGKGYLAATREHNTFLQAKGVLNGDTVAFPVTRLGYFSPGYNLLGNPYQAYLDFERFAAGVYTMRLTTAGSSQVQKIVIR